MKTQMASLKDDNAKLKETVDSPRRSMTKFAQRSDTICKKAATMQIFEKSHEEAQKLVTDLKKRASLQEHEQLQQTAKGIRRGSPSSTSKVGQFSREKCYPRDLRPRRANQINGSSRNPHCSM